MSRLSRYKPRQLKKLRLGQWQELGFGVSIRLQAGLDSDARMYLLDDFLTEAIEGQNLIFGGGFHEPTAEVLEGYVMLDARRGSVTEAQRAAVQQWLQARKDVAEVEVEALTDAWYA
ncbi:YggL family protein [Leeia aquatica]|uniref:DUF469 family protein n=1 Tax=Leeia aquatica TaxID=2725557 RepID=A0A847RU85_9NEIS|nr:YggL family protein [Leeia aquatica]NLR74770.1 DUF469 family protein [Leeia aquatica]